MQPEHFQVLIGHCGFPEYFILTFFLRDLHIIWILILISNSVFQSSFFNFKYYFS
jgi:hypothetical protein